MLKYFYLPPVELGVLSYLFSVQSKPLEGVLRAVFPKREYRSFGIALQLQAATKSGCLFYLILFCYP